jgi:hypothetical protein
MRNKLLGEPTSRQSQIELSATTAGMDNDQTDDQIIEQPTTTDNKPTNYGARFFVHYTHEQRFNTLKKDMHQVYDDIFQNTPAMYTRMVVSTRNRRDAKHEVIRKRPKRTLLRNTITKRIPYFRLINLTAKVLILLYNPNIQILHIQRQPK